MKKLVDIKGYWNMQNGYEFNDKDMWQGKILLEDDGWFEGIVNDQSSKNDGDRLVFGIYHQNKIIQLLKISQAHISDPFVFRGIKTNNGYDGNFSAISFFAEIPCGISQIITKDVTYSKDDSTLYQTEIYNLIKRLNTFKENNDFKELYENTLAMRKQMSEIILRNYMGQAFSEEEKEKLDQDIKQMNEKVEEETIDGIKKLVKEKDIILPF